jgi:uncharacterized protein YdhG (YjbR/CyaY superfamily)
MKSSPKNVGAYIRAAPKETRAKLTQLRRVIKSVAPKAKEDISYRIPYYDYHGALVWFASFKTHISIFLRPPIIAEHKQELKGYVTTKSAVHFPMDKPLPRALIRKLVRARMVRNKISTSKTPTR